MVLSNGVRSARNSASLANRTNECGGVKKGGLSARVGGFIYSNPRMIGATNTQFGLKCTGNYTNGSQSGLRRIRI